MRSANVDNGMVAKPLPRFIANAIPPNVVEVIHIHETPTVPPAVLVAPAGTQNAWPPCGPGSVLTRLMAPAVLSPLVNGVLINSGELSADRGAIIATVARL
jgi:hypothetical protein